MSPRVLEAAARARAEGQRDVNGHRWAAVGICHIDVDQARALLTMQMPERIAAMPELFSHDGEYSNAWALRGPICADCRVSWEDVYAQPTKPWQCPGRRPDPLGGPLTNPVEARRTPNRQQRRAKGRHVAKTKRETTEEQLRKAFASSAWQARVEREANERARQGEQTVKCFIKLGEALREVDDIEGFLA